MIRFNGGILALLPDQRTVTRFWGEADSISRSHLHNMVTNLTGHFTILNMDHTLQARVSRDGSATVQTVDAGHATAWLRGRLVVARTSLSEVIHEIQRYHHGYILIASPALQHIQITGIYDLSNTAETLAVLAKTTPLKMTRMTDRFVILR